MLLTKNNLKQIINNNLASQTPPDSKEQELFDPETTLPLADWLKNVSDKSTITKLVPKNLSVIYSLNLSRSLLEQFPQEILQLTSLKFLILDENFISVIPKNIACLKNLEMLSISNNRLESIGAYVRKLVHLTYLNLAKNCITTLIDDLRQLKSLETLLLQENRFDKLPLYLHEFTKLKELGLDWFLFLTPSLEKTVVQREKDPVFNNIMFYLKRKVGDVTIQEFLLEFSTKKNCQMDPIYKLLNRTYLYKCAANNNLGILSVILKKTPHLMNEINDEGYSLFGHALLNKLPFIPDMLLQMNCDLSKGYGNHNSALNLAICALNYEVCLTLLKQGQNPNIADYEGNTPLHLLFDGRFSQIPIQKAKEICSLLLEAGIHPNTENKTKFTAIHLAIKSDQTLAIEWALKYNRKQRNKFKEIPPQALFDFDKKFGAFYFTSAHYAVFLGKGTIFELMAKYPDEVDLFERCKTGKTPKQVAYKSLSLIKMCTKCEKAWVKSKILNKIEQHSNINKIPEGIMVNQMLDQNKLGNFERPKARSEFHKNENNAKWQKESIIDRTEIDDFEESPMKVGSRSILQVKTIEKAPNDIARINNRNLENNEFEECLKFQNQILLNIQYKSIELQQLEQILKNMMGFLKCQENFFSDRLAVFFYIRLFQYKLNLWTQKFNSKILPYSIFLINTFFNSPTKPLLFHKIVHTLQKCLVNYVESLLKDSTSQDKIPENDAESQNQHLLSEFVRTCLDGSQNTCDPNFSYEKFFVKTNSSMSNYELFHAHKYLILLRNALKKSKNNLQADAVKTTTEKEAKNKVLPLVKKTTGFFLNKKPDNTSKIQVDTSASDPPKQSSKQMMKSPNNVQQANEKIINNVRSITPMKETQNTNTNMTTLLDKNNGRSITPMKETQNNKPTKNADQMTTPLKGNQNNEKTTSIENKQKDAKMTTPIQTQNFANIKSANETQNNSNTKDTDKMTTPIKGNQNNMKTTSIENQNNVKIQTQTNSNFTTPNETQNNAQMTIPLESKINQKIIQNNIKMITPIKPNKSMIIDEHKNENPNLKNFCFNGKNVCMAMTKNILPPNEEEMMVIETTRRCSLKAYYFPSKQDFSPFQTKDKGGLK